MKVVERYWSTVSEEQQSISYYLYGTLARKELENRFIEHYTKSIECCLRRLYLIHRSNFLGIGDNRHISILHAHFEVDQSEVLFCHALDTAVAAVHDQLKILSTSA